jgi:VWFA-related protein
MRKILVGCLIASLPAASTVLLARQTAPAAAISSNLTYVDVGVHDKAGNPVLGLTRNDFKIDEIIQSRKGQTIATVAFAQTAANVTAIDALPVLAPGRLTSEVIAGRSVWVLLFDTSSMERDETRRAARAAFDWMQARMTSSDLVGIATVGSTVAPILDFTNNKDRVLSALVKLASEDGPASGVGPDAPDIDVFNDDARLRGIAAICSALGVEEHRKSLVYFSASRARNGLDNRLVIQAAAEACRRAHVFVDTIDARRTEATKPVTPPRPSIGEHGGGDAGLVHASPAYLPTLDELASLTNGTALDEDSDVSDVFDQAAKDVSSYYILGYRSTNTAKDGGYRQIDVRLRNSANSYKLDHAWAAYHADRDASHAGAAADASPELPLLLSVGCFRLASRTVDPYAGHLPGCWPAFSSDRYGPTGAWSPFDGCLPTKADAGAAAQAAPYDDHNFYVPVSIELPALVGSPGATPQRFELRGEIRDLYRRNAITRFNDTITRPRTSDQSTLEPVREQVDMMMTSGRHVLMVTVRDKNTGRSGSFEASTVVPDALPVHVSSVLLSTESRPAPASAKPKNNPLIQNGIELLPNPTNAVRPDQTMHLYYEVYDPAGGAAPNVRSSVGFYRGSENVLAMPPVEHTKLDDADRHAVIFAVDVPASSFTPGLYTCQITIDDELAGTSVTRTLDVYVRAK